MFGILLTGRIVGPLVHHVLLGRSGMARTWSLVFGGRRS